MKEFICDVLFMLVANIMLSKEPPVYIYAVPKFEKMFDESLSILVEIRG